MEETKKKDALLWLLTEWKLRKFMKSLCRQDRRNMPFILVTKAVKQGYARSYHEHGLRRHSPSAQYHFKWSVGAFLGVVFLTTVRKIPEKISTVLLGDVSRSFTFFSVCINAASLSALFWSGLHLPLTRCLKCPKSYRTFCQIYRNFLKF